MAKFFGNGLFKILRRLKSTKPNRKKQEDNLKDFIILRANRHDNTEVIELMETSYFPREPMCFSLGIQSNPVLVELGKRALSHGMTIIARCKYDGCIVGACVNETTNPWDPDLIEQVACDIKCNKTKQLLLFAGYVQRLPELWVKHKVQKIFEMSYIFIRPDQRKQGIALKLMEESRKLGFDCGFKVIRCNASSVFISKNCQKMEMCKIAEVPYCSYLSRENLQPVFRPPIPHEAMRIYISARN